MIAFTITRNYSSRVSYEWIFSFVVFAEQLNFTRAARQLHISQPALFVQIRKLTEAVGCPLYRRSGRVLKLTDEGRRLAAFGREVQERGRTVLGEVRGERIAEPVVLASGQGAFRYLLGPAIRRFPKSRWPLRLLALPGPDAIDALRDARAHLAVIAADHPPADLRTHRLCAIGQSVVLPRDHRLAARRTLKPRDLDGESIIVAPLGSPHRTMLDQLLAAAGVEWTVAVEANGWDLQLQFARYGVGIAVVNDFCPPPPGMVAVPLAGAPPIAYHLVERAGFLPPGAAALAKMIAETVVER
jgi:DNA-binding transcriptional LysR family regulator